MSASKKSADASKDKQAAAAKYYYRRSRRKVCAFCAEKIEYIDYKHVGRLRRFITDRGKIIPRRQTGTCASHQRELAQAIKRAREMALLPFVAE